VSGGIADPEGLLLSVRPPVPPPDCRGSELHTRTESCRTAAVAAAASEESFRDSVRARERPPEEAFCSSLLAPPNNCPEAGAEDAFCGYCHAVLFWQVALVEESPPRPSDALSLLYALPSRID
ncbi:hypothetical protein Vretifemale_3837, partial [Volvox reticuliferus]